VVPAVFKTVGCIVCSGRFDSSLIRNFHYFQKDAGMKKILTTGIIFIVIIFLITSCSMFRTASLTINSIGINLNNSRTPDFFTDTLPSDFSVTPNWQPHYISSNAPEYLKITVTDISLIRENGRRQSVWSGEKELLIDGPNVDMSDINNSLKAVSPGLVTEVEITFNSTGKVKGSVADNFILDPSEPFTGTPKTYYTKSGYFYNAWEHTGGASSDSVFESGPAEEMEISLNPDGENWTVSFPVNYTILEGDSPELTLLFDLNMVLRFYNGRYLNAEYGQPNPPDPKDKAFFFAHSITVDGGSFIGAFFGEPGSIQGYKTYAVIYDISDPSNNMAGTGWLTLVYDAQGNFLSGQIYGDDDNSISAGKGVIVDYTLNGGCADITDGIMGGTIYNFQPLETSGNTTPVLSFDPPSNFPDHAGEAVFRLMLNTR